MTRPKLLYSDRGTLRAPWRLVIFFAIAVPAWVLAEALVVPLVSSAEAIAGTPGAGDSVAGVAALLLATWICVRFVDHEPWSRVWLGREAARPMHWVEGWLIGALAIGLPCLALAASHELQFAPATPGRWWGAAIRVSWFLLPAALFEELLTRGYAFSVLREAMGWKPALALTSVAFGLLHIPNNASNPEAITMVTLAGVLLGAVILATGSLYAAWMTHFGWNWAMAVPLHSPVSGFPLATPNYQLLDHGPQWLTGGAWGPEGGLAAAAGMMAALIYLYARRARREES